MIFVIDEIFYNYVLLADDTNAFTSNNVIAKPYSETKREFNELCTWLCANKFSMNIEKTNYIVFSKKHGTYISTSTSINKIYLLRAYIQKKI